MNHLISTNQKYSMPIDHATFNYRYFLPYAPEWGSPELCEQRLQELLAFCDEAKIDAVQLFVNTPLGTYYMPATSAEVQLHWAAWVKDRVAPALREIGVSYQLNFQMLLGAGGNKLDLRGVYEWEFLVNQHGKETLGCACPLGKKFRHKMGEMLRLWAQTGPDVIWIDDDFRMHNHGYCADEMDFYCFCETHLQGFAKQTGNQFSREELVKELLRPGPPSDVRLQWLDYIAQTMTESAGWIREQVDEISPGTRLAQMTSSPDVHAAEGRNWKAFMTALSGPYTPIARPCSGIYTGTAVPVKDNVRTFRMMEQTIATFEQTLGVSAVECAPELENTRFTTWCKSVSNTKFVLELGQLLGCSQITLSTNDLTGSPISEESTVAPTLKGIKPRLESLASLNLASWSREGVGFLCDPKSAKKIQLGSDARLQDLGLIRHWEDIILQMGIPARYMDAEEMGDIGSIAVLEEYTAWCPSDDELLKILSGPVLLDGGAAKVVQKRGFGEFLGVEVGRHMNVHIYSERYLDGIAPGVHECRVPQCNDNWYELKPVGAMVLSESVDSMNTWYTGSTIFENRLGGRVAVYSSVGDFQPFGAFGCHARLRWLHGVLRWISREKHCVLPKAPHHMLTLCRRKGNDRLVALANLGTDELYEINLHIRLDKPVSEIKILSREGNWDRFDVTCAPTDIAGSYTLNIPYSLGVFEWLVFLYS